ncbi:hypothetical protein BGW38_003625 [Lunasporangiospora selenospora]|uniref:LIM zinc-binding domain-containing protein n=1 Tax=Lunasporangiospora selenospora TaxID=979761 RepID=A0A9P6G330_9FUNG|nr:hypothetical protein BGW38_003625 [Lunasporangiospora selenospora]
MEPLGIKQRPLDSSILAEHEGEAFCRTCHKKMWGPTGYGYASGLLVPEGPESQFKQSIGQPVNSSGSVGDDDDNGDGVSAYNTLDDAVNRNSDHGGSKLTHEALSRATIEETEEQRRERLIPVNATLKKRNSLDMIREQAEASRRAYDDAHAQRVASKFGRINPTLTGGSTSSIGSGSGAGGSLSMIDANQSDRLSVNSDSSSAFGSTMATTSSPAPSLSSITSSISSQPPGSIPTKSLFLNQSYRGTSTSTTSSSYSQHHQQQQQDSESEYARSRQALSFQTGAPAFQRSAPSPSPISPVSSSGPPSLPKRDQQQTSISPSTTGAQADDSFMDYMPIRVVARKDEPAASTASPTTAKSFGNAVHPDEWDDDVPKKDFSTRNQVPLYQQRLSQPPVQREKEPTPPVSSGSTSSGAGRLMNEADRWTMREQEERQKQAAAKSSSSNTVEEDEWDAEPTPTIPSKPQSLSYMPARHGSSATNRTWTPSVSTGSESLSSPGANSAQDQQSPTKPLTPNTSYYRSGGMMTPKKFGSSLGGGGDICPRCQKTVYAAESALAPGGSKYHKMCLRCVQCSKSLDSTNMTDRQGVPYCKTCYGKAFGAHGYGYGGGASVLHTEL